MTDSNKQTLANRSVDHMTSVVKGAIGIVPIAGPLLAEVVGTLIPNQRVDRLAQFAEFLGQRLTNIEQDTLKAKLTDENFTDTVEESLRQAARSTSNDRRAYIASLLANGINSDHINFVETKHLLKLLGEINDIEVIWLRYYYDRYLGQHDEQFHEQHAATLELVVTDFSSSSQEEWDKKAMQESYKLHLESLGLLQSKIKFDTRTKLPEFDRNEGFKKLGFGITPLGRLLVRYIDMAPTESEV